MNFTRRNVLALLAMGPVSGFSCAAAAGHRLAGAYGESVFHTRNLRAFARRIEVDTDASVRIEVVPNAKLRPMSEVLSALERGEIAFGEVLMSAYGGRHPLLGMDSLPFIVKGFDDAARMWQASREPVRQYLASRGVRLLYAVPWPAQGLFSRAPVGRFADLKGLKFRVYNEGTKRLAELSGALPVTIAANELQRAIESGTVDAMLTSSATGVDSQAWSAMRFFVDMRAWIPKNIVCMSDTAWRPLSAGVKSAITESAAQAEAEGWRLAKDADEEAKGVLKANRIEVGQASPELRRTLDLLGERFGLEWAAKAGMANTSILVDYYNSRAG